MRELIRERALQLGFNECRFTRAAIPESADRFKAWIQEGRHGGMFYLERNAAKRTDPDLVLQGVRSLIVLASSYPDRFPDPRKASGLEPVVIGQGEVARYARGPDYHDLLSQPLKSLTDFVNQLGGSGTRSLWYVDTGPVLERDFGQKAGLGFVGKHTGLISRSLGNGFLISEILTTLELEPDEPGVNRCGSCERCISSCPTKAITAPFQLDARLCISYLTIELKGEIPEHLRPLIGHRVFGCDDCLAACPWNRFAAEARLLSPGHRPDLARLDLLQMLELDDAGFRRFFEGTPMLRSKRRGFLRNVCVVLGNTGDERAIPALERARNDPEPLIALHAAWALDQIRHRVSSKVPGESPGCRG